MPLSLKLSTVAVSVWLRLLYFLNLLSIMYQWITNQACIIYRTVINIIYCVGNAWNSRCWHWKGVQLSAWSWNSSHAWVKEREETKGVVPITGIELSNSHCFLHPCPFWPEACLKVWRGPSPEGQWDQPCPHSIFKMKRLQAGRALGSFLPVDIIAQISQFDFSVADRYSRVSAMGNGLFFALCDNMISHNRTESGPR